MGLHGYVVVLIALSLVLSISESQLATPGILARISLNHDTSPPSDQVLVNVDVHLRKVELICSQRRMLRVHFVIRLNWTDHRLRHDTTEWLQVPSDKIWTPTIYLRNQLQATPQVVPDSSVSEVHRLGTVMLRRLVSADLSCPMRLHNYPLDVQRCPIVISSWELTNPHVWLEWRDIKPVTIARDAFEDVPNFYITRFEKDICSVLQTPYGPFSCLRAYITAERIFSPFLVNVYIPLTMCVLASFTTFWSRIPSVRVTISMISLSLAAFFCHSSSTMAPSTDYTKFIDLFTGIALIFIFGTLLVFHSIMYIYGKDSRRGDKGAPRDMKETSTVVPSNPMDKASRALFPLLYTLFLVVYTIRGFTMS